MKVIIDIPKEVKREFDKTESIALKGAYFDLDGIIGKAIRNGIPLDDVKAEIKRMEYHMIDCDVLVSQEEVLDIIEKHKGVSE